MSSLFMQLSVVVRYSNKTKKCYKCTKNTLLVGFVTMDYHELFKIVCCFCLFVVAIILVVNLKIHAPHAYFKFVVRDGLLWWKPSFKNFFPHTIT
jgi:hypothetical protein